MYFVKTDKRVVIKCERHRIKIPTLGWVRLKEKGYLPTSKSGETKWRIYQNKKEIKCLDF